MPYAASIVEPSNLKEEGTDVTIMTALMAFLADHVMGLVASTRREYLTEFNDYLDAHGLEQPPRSPKTPA